MSERDACVRSWDKGVKSIFVGNLDAEVTEEELWKLFGVYGTVEHVNIIRDRETGLPRGFAFVEMTDARQAAEAIDALNGSILHGRSLRVDYARPRIEGRAG